MVRAYTAAQIRAAEAPHLAAGEPLMQRAAAGLAGCVREVLDARRGDRVLLLVGSGDNGGDALFAGADLARGGAEITALIVGQRAHEAGLTAAADAGVRILPASADDPARAGTVAASADVIVDGIIGTGTSANPALRGTARDVVAQILPIVSVPDGPAVVAVDIPSGVNPDDGTVPDPTVLPATVTVTFGGVKVGLVTGRGAELAGSVRLIDIGIENDLNRLNPATPPTGA